MGAHLLTNQNQQPMRREDGNLNQILNTEIIGNGTFTHTQAAKISIIQF